MKLKTPIAPSSKKSIVNHNDKPLILKKKCQRKLNKK